jgi:hypothetical protein
MNTNRFGRTPDEIEDEARHDYAYGTVRLRAIADKISEIVPTRWEREHHHNELYYLYELLGTHTVFGMGDEPVTDGEPPSVWAYWDTYSDGTPVSIVVGPREAGAGQRPAMCTTAVSRGFPTPLATTATTQMGPYLPDPQ